MTYGKAELDRLLSQAESVDHDITSLEDKNDLFSTFGLFVTLSLLIALIFALIAIMPWLRAPRLQSKLIDNQLLDINVAVFRERLAELQTDKDSGTINSHYQNQKLN